MNRTMPSYQSTGSRDPIWTQVPGDPDDAIMNTANPAQVQTSSLPNIDYTNTYEDQIISKVSPKPNLNVISTAVIITSEIVASGVLALPKAIVNTGWFGLLVLILICINVGYGGTRLGVCWEILEERYPHHRNKTRNPYAMIAFRATGHLGRFVVSGCMQLCLFGTSCVYLLLLSHIVQHLMAILVPSISVCLWFLIVTIIITPAMWFDSFHNYRLVNIGKFLIIAFACVLIFTQEVMDGIWNSDPVLHREHGFRDFFLSLGTILFSIGGVSPFPIIQNKMENKQKFTTSIIIVYGVILMFYLPISLGGFFVYGDKIDTNIITSLSKTTLVVIANILIAFHLATAFLIAINPVCLEIEDTLQILHGQSWKRNMICTGLMLLIMFVGASVPDFSKILALVGGSTVTLLTLVFPSLFYIRLCDRKDAAWPDRQLSLHERVYNWELIIVGICICLTSTYMGLSNILDPETATKLCY